MFFCTKKMVMQQDQVWRYSTQLLVGHHPIEVSSNHTVLFFLCRWIFTNSSNHNHIFLNHGLQKDTFPKFNRSPLKSYLPNRKGSSSNHHFSRGYAAMLNFWGVYISYPFCWHLWFLILNHKSGFQQIRGFMNLEPTTDLQHP